MSNDGTEAMPAPAVRLQLAREPLVQVRTAPAAPLAFRDGALLAWLAIEGPTPRHRLAQLLWPESDAESAGDALRQRLFRLKRQFGEDIVAGRVTLALAPGVAHDLDGASGVLGDVAHALGGELGAWLTHLRGQHRQRVRQMLAERAAAAEERGDRAAALAAAEELLALDLFSEDAHRRVMRLHYVAGDRPLALVAFDRCERILKDEVGIAPSPETLALLHTIEASGPPGKAPMAATPGLPAAVLRPPRLIGREREWQGLAGAWAAARSAIVMGEAGMGKTRLVRDFALAHPDATVVDARPGDARIPYALLSRLLCQMLERVDVSTLAGGVLEELARLLPELGRAEPVQSAADAVRFFNAVAALARQAQSAGLAGLIVDDLQFADAASIEALRYLATAGLALRWIVALRPGELEVEALALHDELLAVEGSESYALQPLTPAQIAELIDSLGVAGLDGAQLGATLARHTGGNPLYVLETLRALFEQGPRPVATDRDPRALVPTLPMQLPRAGNVTRLIEQRITRLSSAAVRLARCAAIAAADFSAELAAHVLGVQAIDLADAWAELDAAQVLHDGAFAHDLIYEAARQSVPKPVALQLHAEIARFLEAHGSEPIRVAQHWLDAGDEARALPALLAAADRAAVAWRSADESRLLRHAARIVRAQGGDASQAFELLKRAHLAQSRADAGNATHLDLLEEMTQIARLPAERAEAFLAHAQLACERSESALARSHAETGMEALASVKGPLTDVLYVDLASVLGKSLFLDDRPVEAADTIQASLPRLMALNDKARHADHLGDLAVFLDAAGHLTHAQQVHRQTIALAREIERRDLEIVAVTNLAVSLSSAGRFAEALSRLQEGWRLREQWPELQAIGVAIELSIGDASRCVGDYSGSLEWLQRALTTFTAHMPRMVGAVHNHLALTWLHLGQYARAQQHMAEARLHVEGVPAAYTSKTRLLMARSAWMQGSPATARAELAAARDLLAHAPERHAPRANLELMAATLAEPEAGYAAAIAVVTDVAQRETRGIEMAALACAARCALANGQTPLAVMHAAQAIALWPAHAPDDSYIGEIWLAAYESFEAAGDARANDLLRQAARWIEETARERVAEEFRESFRHRNPFNRQLLAAAARAGVA